VFEAGGRQLVLPECASWSPPRIYSIEGGAMRPAGMLRVAGDPHVLDPTLIEHDGRLYLFGNDHRVGANALFLWSAADLDDAFVLHPSSPSLVSPRRLQARRRERQVAQAQAREQTQAAETLP
jgi:hypothetical protein